MLFNQTTFIGIDPTAGKRPFTYAALDDELRLLALGAGEMDEVLAFTAGQRFAYAAVSAPRRPSAGALQRLEVRQTLANPPRPGRWNGYRLAEYLLRQHNIPCTPTPASENACAGWQRMGFLLYQKLENAGYRPWPAPDAPLQWLEVYPHAGYTALLGLAPFPKHSLEGRIQRQLALYDQKIKVPDAMDFFEEITRHRLLQGVLPGKDLYSPAELDALLAAFTAWQAALHPERTLPLGDPAEGQLILPVAELKRRY